MLLIANCSPQHLPEAALLLYEVAFVGFRSQRFANAVGTGTEKQSDTPPGANSKEFQGLTEKQRGEKHLKLTRYRACHVFRVFQRVQGQMAKHTKWISTLDFFVCLRAYVPFH